jgi:hypothetical protein
VIEPAIAAPIAGDVAPETAEAATPPAPAAEPSIAAPARSVAAEPLSDPAGFGRDTPERDAWIRRYFESRQALPGESRAGTEEQKRRVKEEKCSGG